MVIDSEVRGALARLQETPLRKDESPTDWLNARKDDVALLILAKGNSTAADLIGVTGPVLNSWSGRRHLRKSQQVALQAPGATPTDDPVYWRARAETLMEIVVLLIGAERNAGGHR